MAAERDALTEQDAGLLNQAAELLEHLACIERSSGNDSAAEGASCSAQAVLRLAAAFAAPPVEQQAAEPALQRACDLLSMTIGTLMGHRAKIGYTDNSPIASLVREVVEFLRPWPEKLPTAQPSQDAEALDWLETMTVNVRTPLRYGSHDLFWATPEDRDGEAPGPSDIRAKIAAARAAQAQGESKGGTPHG